MRHFPPGCHLFILSWDSILSERCIYVYKERELSSKQTSRSAADCLHRLPREAARLARLGTRTGRPARLGTRTGRPSCDLPSLRWAALRPRGAAPRPSLCGAPLPSAPQPGVRSWAAGDGAGGALPALVVAAVAAPAPGAGPREGLRCAAKRAGPTSGARGLAASRSAFPRPALSRAGGAPLWLWPLQRRAGQRARRLLEAESASGCLALLLLPRTLESNPSSRIRSDSG